MSLTTFIVFSSAFHIVLRTRFDKQDASLELSDCLRRLDLRLVMHAIVWSCFSVLAIFLFRWPIYCSAQFESRIIQRLLVLAPIIAWLVLSWSLLYSAEIEIDNSVRRSTRGNFVWGQTRLYLLVPLTVILFVVLSQDLFDSPSAPRLPEALRIVPLVIVVLLFPTIFRFGWKTAKLSSAELRTRLDALCEAHNFRARGILVWKTEGRMRNAAITGFFPALRYVLLSDRLIEDLETDQIECVFLHEISHAKQRHQSKLLVVSITLATVFMVLLTNISSNASVAFREGLFIFAMVAAVMGIRLLGSLSRIFEFQADSWAIRNANIDSERYCQTLISLSGNRCNQRTWSHPSANERIRQLKSASSLGRQVATVTWQFVSLFGIVLVLIAATSEF